MSTSKMAQDEKVVHEDVFGVCPDCGEWRMRVRGTNKWDMFELECFDMDIDLRCLNCGFHKHFWANNTVDVENIFGLCGLDLCDIADVLTGRMRNEEKNGKNENAKNVGM